MRTRGLILLLVVLSIAIVGSVEAATLTVPTQYPTIQGAITAAAPGDTIIVYGKTTAYTGQVNVNKTVLLVGSNNGNGTPILEAGGATYAFNISAPDVELSGFRIRNASYAGIYLSSTGNTIHNNTVTLCYYGVQLDSADLNEVLNNNLSYNWDYGIYLEQSSGNTIRGNVASDNDDSGIYLYDYSENNTIDSNIADRHYYHGIFIDGDCPGTSIINNTVRDNGEYGILVSDYSDYTNVFANTATGNEYGGIYLDWPDFCEVNNNVVQNNVDGIWVAGYGNTLLNNSITGNSGTGLYYRYMDGARLEGNWLQNNSFNVYFSISYTASHNVVATSNLIDGKPVYYLENCTDLVFDGSSDAGAIYLINCNNVTVTGMTLSHNGQGVYLYNTSYTTIQDTTFHANDYAIDLYAQISNSIYTRNITITRNVIDGTGQGMRGISAYEPTSITITDNLITNVFGGIEINWGSGITLIRNNTVQNSVGGILANSLGGVIEDNTIDNGTNGLQLSMSSKTVRHNTITRMSQTGIYINGDANNLTNNSVRFCLYGVNMLSGNNNIVQDSTLTNNQYGFYLNGGGYATGNILTNSTISNNTVYGIYFTECSDTKIYRNTIANNTNRGIYIVGMLGSGNVIYLNNFQNTNNAFTTWDQFQKWNATSLLNYTFGGQSRAKFLGNYWNNYAGTDTNGDGIGDTPYNITSTSKDLAPLIQPWENYFGTPSNGTSPIIVNPLTIPAAIPDDTDGVVTWGENSTLSVNVTDDAGVASVTINLTAIGGSSAAPMTNIGGSTWSITTASLAGKTSPYVGTYQPLLLTVNATDTEGLSNISVPIPLIVMKNGDVTEDNSVTLFDAMYVAKHALNQPGFVTMKDNVGEVTGEGTISLFDAMYLAKNVLKQPGFGILH